MDNQPLISIGIPTRNRINYLKEAIKSSLNQTYKNIEIIISDNASNDGTQEYLKYLNDDRIRALNSENLIDMAENWNKCLLQAKGSYFMLLSDDDILEENAIKDLLDIFLESKQKISFSYGKILYLGAKNYQFRRSTAKPPSFEVYKDTIENFFLADRFIVPCGMLFSLSDIRTQNLIFSDKFKLVTDLVFWINLLMKVKGFVGYTDNTVAKYRIHSNSTTNNLNQLWQSERNNALDYYISSQGKEVSKKFIQNSKFVQNIESFKSSNFFDSFQSLIKFFVLYKPNFNIFMRFSLKILILFVLKRFFKY